MKFSTPSLFFGLAIFLAILWGSVEFILYSESPVEGERMCVFTDAGNGRILAQNELLSFSNDLLWTFNSGSEKVLKYRTSSEVGVLEDALDSGVQFRCQVPGYQCFAKIENGGFETLRPVVFQENVFLVEGLQKDAKLLFPVLLTDQGINLSAPLKMCNAPLKPKPEAYSVNPERVLYFDAEKGLLGVWFLQGFPGAVTKAVAREPDQIFQIKEGVGFEASNCQDQADRPKALVQFFGNDLILVNDAGLKVETRVYAVSESLSSSREASPLLQKGVTALKGSLSLVGFSTYENDALVIARSRRFLAPLNLALVTATDFWNFPAVDWTWRRREIPRYLARKKSKDSGWLFLQQNEGIVIREFKCSP